MRVWWFVSGLILIALTTSAISNAYYQDKTINNTSESNLESDIEQFKEQADNYESYYLGEDGYWRDESGARIVSIGIPDGKGGTKELKTPEEIGDYIKERIEELEEIAENLRKLKESEGSVKIN